MFNTFSGAPLARRSAFASLAGQARFGVALVPALLLPLAAANAFPITPSAGCTPSPYTTGDLTCTNSGTITSSGADGINAPANGGNATTTNSGTVNATGNVTGILTTTNTGNATTTNQGAVNVTGNVATGIATQVIGTGDATTNNYGTVTVTGNGTVIVTGNSLFTRPGISPGPSSIFGFNFGIVTSTFGNATTNNYGTVSVSGFTNNIGILTASSFAPPVTQFGASILAPINTTATTNNYGSVSVSGNGSTGIITGPGFFGPTTLLEGNVPAVPAGGTATTNNYGTVNVIGFGGIGISTIAAALVTAPATFSAIPLNESATTNNFGNVSVNGTVNTSPPVMLPLADAPAFRTGAAALGIQTATTFGNATTNNYGSVNVTSFNSTGIQTSTSIGTATTVNSGIVNVVGGVTSGRTPTCGGSCGSSVGVSTSTVTGNSTVINSGIISALGPNNTGVTIASSGTSLLVNSGIISAPGGIAVQFSNPLDPATLTLQQGSLIVGAINLIGAGDTVNVNAGNQNFTFNTLAGVTVNGNVPFIVSGNSIVSIDPTGFAVTDRALMDFTRAVSASLGGRANDATASRDVATGRALGFAGFDDSAARFEDPFDRVMGYAKAPDSAVMFKNPTMTAPDGTTVWAKGFYGQRTQQADGPVLRNVSNFYGGMLGVDRPVQPDLRLGGFLGGGAINTSIDFNSGSSASDIVFAGVYGRQDIGPVFIDFALLGGHTGNSTTRNVNNNLLANGLEIATASFGGWFLSPEIASGYRYDFAPGWTVTPALRLRYLAASYDGFTETGSTANLTAGGRTLADAEERADVTLTRTIVGDAGRFQVGLTGGVIGQQRTGAGSVNAILLGQALAFATPGPSSITGGYAGVSLDWRVRSNISMFAAAEYIAMTDSSNTVTGKAGLRVGF